jgi:hypothetical protein
MYILGGGGGTWVLGFRAAAPELGWRRDFDLTMGALAAAVVAALGLMAEVLACGAELWWVRRE